MLQDRFGVWRCGDYELSLARPRVMGILNVTPDSFSDGGSHVGKDQAVEHALRMLDEGADIIDVGGESRRPGFAAVSAEEEAQRVVPVVADLVAQGVIVSVDTRNAELARVCLRLGASIINDVTGFSSPEMVELAASSGCGCVIMHAGKVPGHAARRSVQLDGPALGTHTDKVPASDRLQELMDNAAKNMPSPSSSRRPTTTPEAAPILRQVMGFLGDQARTLMRAGVDRERLCVDPGAGFGKFADEDVVIQRATAKLASMGYPLMCAVSRKRVVGATTAVSQPQDRDAGSIGMALAALQAGARVFRVHDVAGTAQALNTYWAMVNPVARKAYISLGSYVGERMSYLSRARALIDAIPLTCVTGTSHVYETEPAYGIRDAVANCVVEIKTELAPLVLLDALMDVETQLGRTRDWRSSIPGPRTIDCDLVWMEDEIHTGRKLKLPHPGFGERDYVLRPLADLMRDPERFFTHAGIELVPAEERVGKVVKDLGELHDAE
ncbi:MAG: dihydropteroate synthase [Atopobiaceae bacterium]|nr:dihydropteroate synthase [Atopobiaceae bacterium]